MKDIQSSLHNIFLPIHKNVQVKNILSFYSLLNHFIIHHTNQPKTLPLLCFFYDLLCTLFNLSCPLYRMLSVCSDIYPVASSSSLSCSRKEGQLKVIRIKTA